MAAGETGGMVLDVAALDSRVAFEERLREHKMTVDDVSALIDDVLDRCTLPRTCTSALPHPASSVAQHAEPERHGRARPGAARIRTGACATQSRYRATSLNMSSLKYSAFCLPGTKYSSPNAVIEPEPPPKLDPEPPPKPSHRPTVLPPLRTPSPTPAPPRGPTLVPEPRVGSVTVDDALILADTVNVLIDRQESFVCVPCLIRSLYLRRS